ncbi:hypothetical protein FGE12_16910 [Aggregicoccus sp. 17bor-14]|uniref:hypothetical protein n=1 Tax=Myxococcaceae TaxID=31 RepID=UPI00129C13EC|nr:MULTISPECIES: hypothetical protein [Myxococcaceae]MBF5044082.1 hypothetical protein [Simulacricoccus sp. 17bor-14]MRI89833.1 hypothetical protein [Aggregicoccus sp. 17bor-14]
MKNLRHALAFSASVLLLAGCPKKGVESPERPDAAPTASTGSSSASLSAPEDAGAPQAVATEGADGGTAFEGSATAAAGAATASTDAGNSAMTGGLKQAAQKATRDAGTAGSASTASGATDAGSGSASSAREACVDRWLASHQLDRYGNPRGTVYAGGSPLFDESTGQSTDRLEYVFARKPDAKSACPQ